MIVVVQYVCDIVLFQLNGGHRDQPGLPHSLATRRNSDLMTSTIAERDGRWHVVIEGTDSQPVHKSFGSYGRAKAWQTRHQAARLRYAPEASAPNPFVDTLGDLLNRYNREVSSQKRGAKAEA